MPCGSNRDFMSAACSAWPMAVLDFGHDYPRRAGRRQDAEPGVVFKLGDTRLFEGRNIRKSGQALGAGNREGPHLTALNEVAARVEEGEAHGDIAADDGGVGLGQPSDGKIDNVSIGNLFE